MGGNLIVSRQVKLFPHIKKEFERFGFKDVHLTCNDNDGLIFKIQEIRPEKILICSSFNHSCTPFKMKELLKIIPGLNITAINFYEYPDDLAMKFIINGVKSYVNIQDGMDEFKLGLSLVRDGKQYISNGVKERLEMRSLYPKPAGNITDKHIEIIRLICNGFKEDDICKVLCISRRTINNHKTEIFTSINVRNSIELIKTALTLNLISLDEINFYPRDFTVNPQPDKRKNRKQITKKKEKLAMRGIS